MAKTEEQLSVLDLCSGMGDFSDTFAAEGWRVVGVDITMFPEYKHSFIQADGGAEKYMGEAKEKYGSFYFWYDVPPMPNVKATKGFTVKKGRGMAGEYERHPGFKEMAAKVGCKATRAYFAAQKAMIPKGAVKIISDYYKAKLIK